MEIYILSKENLKILSVTKPSEYEINIDEETNGKSTFNLIKSEGLKKGNYMVVNGLYEQFLFLIDDVETEKGSNVSQVTALDISNIFDRKIIEKDTGTMTSNSIEQFIANTISENFVNSDDTHINVGYINISWKTNTKVSVSTNAENGLYNFHTFLINCRQYKNIYTTFKFQDNKLNITIENKDNEQTRLIDTTLPEVTEYNKVYESDITAKVQVLIREDNSVYNLYLKADRTTTENKDDPDRVNGKVETISVETAADAREEALNVMKGNKYNHLVEFKIAKTSKLMDVKEFHIGRLVRIKTEDDIYDSYISAITLRDENFIYFKSGNLRTTLLDKLKKESQTNGNKLDLSGGVIKGNITVNGKLTPEDGIYVNGKKIIDFNGTGMAIGKESSAEGLEVGMNIYDKNGNQIISNATLPSWIANSSNLNKTITINGSADTYYPVVITLQRSKEMPQTISIWKNLGTKTASYSGNHSNGTSSLWLLYEGRSMMWDGNGGYFLTKYKTQPYASLVSHVTVETQSNGNMIIWLRGGGTTYNISSDNSIDVNVYYSNTNIGTSSYPTNVAPRTDIGNGGVYSNTYVGYGNITGNANYATTAGSASSATNANYATSAGSASSATNATNANYATSAGSATYASKSSADFYAGNHLRATWSVKAENGYLYSTANGNTVQIGSQNASWCHIYNSANIPFYFNRDICINGLYPAKQRASSFVNNTGGNKSYILIGDLQICWGRLTITPTANTPTKGYVTFPRAFATTPAVTIAPVTSVPGSTVKGAGISDTTVSGVNLYIYRTNATSTSIDWIAVGKG